MPLTVVIPSAGRADRVKTDKAITADVLCVPESEAAAYARARLRRRGRAPPGLGPRPAGQAAVDRRPYGDVFMVDDDVRAFVRLWLPTYRRDYRMTAEEARDAAEATYETATELGAYLFGFAFFGDTRLFRPQRPFLLTGYVNGACFGLRAGSKLRFRTDVVAVEDLALSRDERLLPPLPVRRPAVRPAAGEDVRQPRRPGPAPDGRDRAAGHGDAPPAVRGGGGGEAGQPEDRQDEPPDAGPAVAENPVLDRSFVLDRTLNDSRV